MVVCTGGSQPKPATAPTLFIFGDALTALMERYFGGSKWVPLVAFIAGQVFNADTLCASDPPDMPVWNGTTDFLFPPIFPFLSDSGVSKLATMVEIAAWHTFCDCIVLPTPPAPPAPPYPPNAVVINPPQILPPTGQLCWDVKGTSYWTAIANVTPNGTDITPQYLPTAGTFVDVQAQTEFLTRCYQIPAGVNNLKISVTWFSSALPGQSVGELVLSDDTGTTKSGTFWDTTGLVGNTRVISIPTLPAFATHWGMNILSGFPNQTVQEAQDIEVSFFCGGGAPPNPVVPCCPPDATALGFLQLILTDVQELLTRASLPRLPLYQASAVHAGLSGSGSVVIQTSAVAFRVDVTSDLTHWPNNPGDPNYYFSMGFITSFAVETPIKGWRLVYSGQVFPLAAQCDAVGFTLPPGISVTITELLEQPGA